MLPASRTPFWGAREATIADRVGESRGRWVRGRGFELPPERSRPARSGGRVGTYGAATAAAASSRPPVATFPAREDLGSTEFRIALRMAATLSLGWPAKTSAAVPATSGAAN